MAKRFIDSEIFKDEWFCDLSNTYKLLWIYLITNCDNAGIYKVSLKQIQFNVSKDLLIEEIEEILKDRIILFDNGNKWFIPKFLKFQYPKGLNSNKPAIVSVYDKIIENNLQLIIRESFGNDYLTIKDKDTDIEKDIVIVKNKGNDTHKDFNKDKIKVIEKEKTKDLEEIFRFIERIGKNNGIEDQKQIEFFKYIKQKKVDEISKLNHFERLKKEMEKYFNMQLD